MSWHRLVERTSRHVWLAPAVLCLLAGLHQLIYFLVIPPWQGPDEPRHFEYIAQVAGRISPGEPEARELQWQIIQSMIRHDFWAYGYYMQPYEPSNPPGTLDDIWPGFAHETHQPPLYYWLAGALVRITDAPHVDGQLRVARLLSMVLGVGVVLIAWLTARTLFAPQIGVPFLIGLFVALLPMHAFMNVVANNDNLAALLVSIVVLFSTRIVRHGFRWTNLIFAIAATILALFTKRTALIAPVVLAATLAAALWDRIVGAVRSQAGRRVLPGMSAALVVILVGAWTAWHFSRPTVQYLWNGLLHLPPDVLDLLSDGKYADALVNTPYPYYTRMVFESFWARFGWLNVRLPSVWYWILAGMVGLAGIGWLASFCRAWRGDAGLTSGQRRCLVVFSVGSAIACLLIFAKEILFLSYQFGVTPQGRYLYPVIIPLATLLIIGLREATPPTWRWAVAGTGTITFALFSTVCIIGYVVPYFSS